VNAGGAAMTVPSIVQPNGEMTRSRAGVPLLRLKYTPDTHLKVYHRIELDDGVALEVYGDGSNASYEWALLDREGPTKYSDSGYGITFVALRDGLIEYWGAAEHGTNAIDNRQRRSRGARL